jgi:hypothetical protein
MAASWSGILTIIFLLFAGPLVYGFIWLYNKHHFRGETGVVEDSTALPPDEEQKKIADSNLSAESDPEDQTIEKKAATHDELYEHPTRKVLESNEYLIALVRYVIRIGNLWRFPYMIEKIGEQPALWPNLSAWILLPHQSFCTN